jgi:hypothetical protein
MTDHLTDAQLNEILDGRAEFRHLDACMDCRARFDDLCAVFTALESLPEAKLHHDLTPSIFARLPQRRACPAWKWLFAAQAVGALAIVASMAPSFAVPAEVAAYQPPTLDALLASFFSLISNLPIQISTFQLQVPTFNFELSTFNLTVLITSAALLWLVGNGLLLCAPVRRSRK